MLMDVILKHDDDSDVEILQPDVLQDHFRQQQLRLITALSKCRLQIPKKWEDFEIFAKKVLKFQLSADLIRSVWVKLCAAEHLTNNFVISDTVEISDGEEDHKQIEKDDKKEQFTKSPEVINGETESGCRVNQFCGEHVIDTVEISDEEQEKNSLCLNYVEEKFSLTDNPGENNDDKVSKLSLERSFNLSTGTKRKLSRKRRSLPVSMDEEEAEALREKLILDKIIELELSQIIKEIAKNNKLRGKVKRRKKKIIKKKVFNGLLVDGNGSQEIP